MWRGKPYRVMEVRQRALSAREVLIPKNWLDGKPLRAPRLGEQQKRARDVCNRPGDFVLHWLRHTFGALGSSGRGCVYDYEVDGALGGYSFAALRSSIARSGRISFRAIAGAESAWTGTKSGTVHQTVLSFQCARVAKSADATDLKSVFRQRECGFNSRPGHQRSRAPEIKNGSVAVEHRTVQPASFAPARRRARASAILALALALVAQGWRCQLPCHTTDLRTRPL